MSSFTIYLSDRQIPLTFTGPLRDKPVLCAELYMKWYSLFLIEPTPSGARVTAVKDLYERLCDLERESRALYTYLATTRQSVMADHIWNPVAVEHLANQNGWHLCDLTKELLIGRWELEYKENYDSI